MAKTTRTRASFFTRFHVVTTRDYIAIGGVQCASVRLNGPLVKQTRWQLQGLHLDWRWSCWRCCRHSLEPQSRTVDWLTDTSAEWNLLVVIEGWFCSVSLFWVSIFIQSRILWLEKHLDGFGNIEIRWHAAATDHDKIKNNCGYEIRKNILIPTLGRLKGDRAAKSLTV